MHRPTALAALTLVTAGLIGCAPSRPAATAPLHLTDGELLGVFAALNQGVLLTSRPATASEDEDIRDYAQRMVETHQAAAPAGAEAAPSEVSRELEQIARGNAERLSALHGAELDSAYVRTQVALQRQMMDWVEYVLVPQASPALAAVFQEARPKAEQHLEEIWAIHNLRLLAE